MTSLAASAGDVEVTRKQALLVSAVLASGASSAHAEDMKLKVKSLMKEDPTPNDNGAPEKHIPKVTVSDGSVEVLVPHVMDKEKPHYIEYVWVSDASTGEVLSVKSFAPTDASPPTLTASLPKGTVAKPMLFCNLHGLWEGEKFTV